MPPSLDSAHQSTILQRLFDGKALSQSSSGECSEPGLEPCAPLHPRSTAVHGGWFAEAAQRSRPIVN
jgi:hypothetical protein